MIQGELPNRALTLVREWAMIPKENCKKPGRFVAPMRSRLRFNHCREGKRFMYWDIVEVIPKAGYSLFVRFKDGLEGLVHMHREQLTGALEPLRDENFFKLVFIDNGAVAWPGEIDLAPDAMYAEVSGEQKKTELAVQRHL